MMRVQELSRRGGKEKGVGNESLSKIGYKRNHFFFIYCFGVPTGPYCNLDRNKPTRLDGQSMRAGHTVRSHCCAAIWAQVTQLSSLTPHRAISFSSTSPHNTSQHVFYSLVLLFHNSRRCPHQTQCIKSLRPNLACTIYGIGWVAKH